MTVLEPVDNDWNGSKVLVTIETERMKMKMVMMKEKGRGVYIYTESELDGAILRSRLPLAFQLGRTESSDNRWSIMVETFVA